MVSLPHALLFTQSSRGAVTHSSCSSLQSTALAALPVAQLMMHIQRPLPISSSGDFSVIHELWCIQLNKKHVLCTAEISLYQGLNTSLERESTISSSKFSSIYYLLLQHCLWDYLLHGNHVFPDLVLPMSGPSNGDTVGYCCSGKSVSLDTTRNNGETLLANSPKYRGSCLLMSLASVLVGNISWTSLEEHALPRSGRGQLWPSSLIMSVCFISKTSGTTVGQIQPNSSETEISS